jgi:23S rRNA pseudouridine1911/1915/1917 synthase
MPPYRPSTGRRRRDPDLQDFPRHSERPRSDTPRFSGPPGARGPRGADRPPPKLRVLYEDNHLLAIDKPPFLPTMGVKPGEVSVYTLAKDYLKQKYDKPGDAYIGIVSRLDAPVTGVVLLARTSKAAARLTKLFETREIEKTYWAVVAGIPVPSSGELTHSIRHNEELRRMEIVPEGTRAAQTARLKYRMLQRIIAGSLLEIELETGRKHQIRVQLAAIKQPILGDRKYGSKVEFPDGIALHARRLALIHPVQDTPLEIIAPLPPVWRKLGFFEP